LVALREHQGKNPILLRLQAGQEFMEVTRPALEFRLQIAKTVLLDATVYIDERKLSESRFERISIAKLPASCSDFCDAAIRDFTALRNSATACERALAFGEEKLLRIQIALRKTIGAVVLGIEGIDFTFEPPNTYLLDALLVARPKVRRGSTSPTKRQLGLTTLYVPLPVFCGVFECWLVSACCRRLPLTGIPPNCCIQFRSVTDGCQRTSLNILSKKPVLSPYM